MLFVFNLGSVSQAESRRFDPGLPLHIHERLERSRRWRAGFRTHVSLISGLIRGRIRSRPPLDFKASLTACQIIPKRGLLKIHPMPGWKRLASICGGMPLFPLAEISGATSNRKSN
jgi:hypothetical protein